MADFGTFGSALGGLFTGLAQGAEAGISLSQKQQALDLEAQKQKLGAVTTLANIRKIPLEMRKIVMPGLLKTIETTYGVPLPDAVKKMAVSQEDDQWGKTIDETTKFIMTGKGDVGTISAGIKALGDPVVQSSFLSHLATAKRGTDIGEYRDAILGLRRAGTTSTTATTGEGVRTTVRQPNLGVPPPATVQPPAKIGPTPTTPLGPLPEKTDDQKAAEVTGLLDTANRGPQFGKEGVPGRPPAPTTIPLEADKTQQMAEIPPPLRGDTTKTGEEYLKTLPPAYADLIRAKGNYLSAPPPNTAMGVAQEKQIRQAFPDYDAKNWVQYKKAITDFSAGGQAGKNVISLTTAIGHMGTMFDLYQALNSGNVPAVNAVVNAARRATGDPNITNIDAARQALADELKRVFTVVGVGTEADRKGWFDILSAAKTPEQANGVLRTMSKLLESRVGALRKQWEDQGPPGRPMPGYPTGEAEAALRKIQATAQKSVTPTAPGASAPMTATNPKTGQRIRSLDGGKTWQPVQ